MSFVSYAQNYEDVMLWRALRDIEKGVYIDVGAWSPDLDSVTRAFSERGWHGINIEPNPAYFAELVERRPNDINLDIAVGDHPGTISMSFIPESGLSTADERFIREYESAGYALNAQNVEVSTLAAIWAEHLPHILDVHFLKVDVEGFERAVLSGNDWARFRPWIVVVEATLPNSQIENHEEWEEILLKADYLYVYADGLNRYYVAQEHPERIDAFKYPPNVFDEFVPVNLVDTLRKCEKAEAALQAAEQRIASDEQRLVEAHQRVAWIGQMLDGAKTRVEAAEKGLIEAQQRERATRDAAAKLEAQADGRASADLLQASAVAQQYEAILRSRSWRLTAPLRRLSQLVPKAPLPRLRGAAKPVLQPVLEGLHCGVRRYPSVKRIIWSLASLAPPIKRRLTRFAEARMQPTDARTNRDASQLWQATDQSRAAGTGTKPIPILALDMYVLAQNVKTGVYRVCDSLLPLLAKAPQVDTRLFYRDGDEAKAAPYVAAKGLTTMRSITAGEASSANADILLSPFGVAPADWLLDPRLLHAHIIYDLIAINRPDFFSAEAAAEVKRIIDSLDEHTVVFAISEFTKKDLLAHRPDLSPRQITVIPLAAGPAFQPCNDASVKAAIRSKYGIPADVPYVLSLATLEIRKNLDQVVNAFVLFLKQNEASQMHLVLSGMAGWKLEQLKGALAAADTWRHRIILTGFVDDEDLSSLYSDALCFLYLSRYEGFGLPPLEAMACGTPVITSDNSSLPEVVGQAGVMLDADDVQGVADALQKIEASEELRQELGNAGLERAKLFSWKRCAGIIIDVLSDAYVRHIERPANRRPRTLAPGVLTASTMRADGAMEANFVNYQNGSRGPCFSGSPRAAATCGKNDIWPVWKDRLQAQSGTGLSEGGLRTRGLFKTGSEEQPLVTYITVVRNNPATLARTIESVQDQTYPNVEHIVLDGASTDGTLDVIRQHADRLDYFASEPDRGLYDAVNKAIPLARGQLICVLNSDDWLEPHAAEIAVHRMAQVKGAALLLTAAKVQSADVDAEWYPAFVHPGCYFKCANDCHNGIYATRPAYEKSGPYDSSYKIAADFKWIMTCLEAGAEFIYTREVTVNYSLGGVSSDGEGHSLESMRIVRERFPTLTQSDVEGLYDCFFLFQNVLVLSSRPANRTEFLRDLFIKHASQPDFLQALAWASIEKVEYAQPSVGRIPAGAGKVAAVGASTGLKNWIKDRLRTHPLAYKAARGASSLIRKRQ